MVFVFHPEVMLLFEVVDSAPIVHKINRKHKSMPWLVQKTSYNHC